MNIFHSGLLKPYLGMEYNKSPNRIRQQVQHLPIEGQTTVTHNGHAFKLTFSDEMKAFANLAETNIEKYLPSIDPDDIFSYAPHDQWEVFDGYLRETGYLHSLTKEERQDVKQLLQDMTRGLDSLTQNGIPAAGTLEKALDSHEAQIEFASSITALQLFSSKFLGGDIKTGFDQLVNDYVKHNEKKLQNYQSLEERFITARSKLDISSSPLNRNEEHQLRMLNKLGRVVHTGAEALKLQQFYREQFGGIQKRSDIHSVLLQVKEQMLNFVTKGIPENDSDRRPIESYISTRYKKTFKRMESYWERLLGN